MTLLGARSPRLRVVPPYSATRGPEVCELAALAGLDLDGWQADAVADICAVREDGRWSTLEACEVVARQNGKGSIIEALKLAHLFLFPSRLIVYSAHRFDTSREMFIRTAGLVQDSAMLSRRVRRIYEANGKEGIELKDGTRLKYITRSDKAARGFSGDAMILDEAMVLDSAMMGAIMPTLSARPNPQIVYASSSGWEISTQLGKLRRRALAALLWQQLADGRDIEAAAMALGLLADDAKLLLGKADGPFDPSLCYREFSVPDTTPRLKSAMANPALWAQANPALGIRITPEFVAAELRSMSSVEFGRERLGLGDYPPDEDDDGWSVISEDAWAKLAHPARDVPRGREGAVEPGESGPQRPTFSIDLRPDRTWAAIGAAYADADGNLVAEVVAHDRGVGWVVPRLIELIRRYDPIAVALDTVGPSSSLIPELHRTLERLEAEDFETVLGVELLELSTGDVAQAYGQFHEYATDTGTLRHLDQEPLNEAVKAAGTRPLGDRVTWDRKGADGDISPLVACTNALHAHIRLAHLAEDPLSQIW